MRAVLDTNVIVSGLLSPAGNARLILAMAFAGQPHTFAEGVERLGQEFQLSDDDRAQLLKSGQTRLYNRVGWTTTYLKKAGLLQAVGPGRFQLTDRGRDVRFSGGRRREATTPGCCQQDCAGPQRDRPRPRG